MIRRPPTALELTSADVEELRAQRHKAIVPRETTSPGGSDASAAAAAGAQDEESGSVREHPADAAERQRFAASASERIHGAA